MKLINYEENHNDGSALLTLDLTENEVKALLNSAIVIGLIEGLNNVTENRLNDLESKANLGNPRCGESDSIYGAGVQPCKSGEQEDGFKTSQVLG